MKKSAHLQKLYALLLLAVISISMLPVKLLHRHEEAHFSVPSAHHSQNESFTAGDQAYCPVCLYTFAHHYLPGTAAQAVLRQLPAFYPLTGTIHHLPAEPGIRCLRGPPSC